MCFNCPDFIDQCFKCGNPDGGPYDSAMKFYADELYCEHLREAYGHSVALMSDRYGDDDEGSS